VNAAALIPIAIKASICLVVAGLGLRASPEDALYLLRRPGQLARSLLAMNVIMPLLAATLAATLHLRPPVQIALAALAVSPVPPMLPRRQMQSGGHEPYAIGLLTAAALLAILFVPAAVALFGWAFGIPLAMPPAAVAEVILASVLVPLVTGLLIRRAVPAFAERIARPVSLAGTVLLVMAALPVLFVVWRGVVSLIGDGTLLAVVGVVIAGLTAGHFLGGPDPQDRIVLALASATRHPGVALAIATANFPGQKLVQPAVLLYLIVSVVVAVPYLVWARREPGFPERAPVNEAH
jgi:BASS family bile acid:Na+ symporter